MSQPPNDNEFDEFADDPESGDNPEPGVGVHPEEEWDRSDPATLMGDGPGGES